MEEERYWEKSGVGRRVVLGEGWCWEESGIGKRVGSSETASLSLDTGDCTVAIVAFSPSLIHRPQSHHRLCQSTHSLPLTMKHRGTQVWRALMRRRRFIGHSDPYLFAYAPGTSFASFRCCAVLFRIFPRPGPPRCADASEPLCRWFPLSSPLCPANW